MWLFEGSLMWEAGSRSSLIFFCLSWCLSAGVLTPPLYCFSSLPYFSQWSEVDFWRIVQVYSSTEEVWRDWTTTCDPITSTPHQEKTIPESCVSCTTRRWSVQTAVPSEELGLTGSPPTSCTTETAATAGVGYSTYIIPLGNSWLFCSNWRNVVLASTILKIQQQSHTEGWFRKKKTGLMGAELTREDHLCMAPDVMLQSWYGKEKSLPKPRRVPPLYFTGYGLVIQSV